MEGVEMNRQCMTRIVQIAVAAITIAAIVQELRKPKEKRTWHGKVLFIPYEFRKPTLERVKETFWNPYEKHILTPMLFGIGWTINFHALFENLGLIQQPDASEEDFLLPNKRMKQLLRRKQATRA